MANKLIKKLSLKFAKYQRVWRLLKKPTVEEFKTISKASAIGLVIVGLIGFVISVAIKFVL